MSKKKNNKGFSLIELIIAIAILVILTGLLAPQFMKYIEKSREAKDVQAMDTVYSTVQAALASEAAYNEMVSQTAGTTGDDNKTTYQIYNEELGDILDTSKTDDFSKEMQSLLSKENIDLQSRKAKDNGICVAIKYSPVITTDDVEIMGGFEIMVYCGVQGEAVKGFEIIGTDFASELTKPTPKP